MLAGLGMILSLQWKRGSDQKIHSAEEVLEIKARVSTEKHMLEMFCGQVIWKNHWCMRRMWSTSRAPSVWVGMCWVSSFQITLLCSSRPLKTDLCGPHQWTPSSSGFPLGSANCRHQQENGAWEEKGHYPTYSLCPWSTWVGVCSVIRISSLLSLSEGAVSDQNLNWHRKSSQPPSKVCRRSRVLRG